MANGIYAFTGHINQAAPARWRQAKPMVSDRKVINLLQLLYEAEVDARLSEAEWLESSRKLIAYIKIQKLELPEIVWHYLSDCDIRLKMRILSTDQSK